MKYIIIFIILIFNNAFASNNKLPIPRFVSIKSSESNIRTGPNLRYPIKWIFKKKNEPVEIIAEFEHWRKIKDYDNDEGWIHETMLKGTRTGIIKSNIVEKIYSKPDQSQIIAEIEPNVRVKINICKIDLCQISVDNVKGWINREYIWGIYRGEEFNTK